MITYAKSKPFGALVIEGHVQGLSIARSLGEKNIPVYVLDKNVCIAKYSRYCSGFFRCPDYDSDEFIEFLLALNEKHGLNGWVLYPTNDFAVYNISRNIQSLQGKYKTTVSDIGTYQHIYNKRKTIEIAKRLEIPVPLTLYLSDSSEYVFNINYPAIIKGIEGLRFYKSNGRKVFYISTREELPEIIRKLNAANSLNNTMIQEVIPHNGSNYVTSFTAFSIDGDIRAFWMGRKLREHPRRFGTATFCDSVYEEILLEYSKKLLKEIGYTGVCEIEFLQDPRTGEYNFIEINGRTWLWVDLARKCGVDYPFLIYNYLHDLDFEYFTPYSKNIKWYHFWTESFYNTAEILRGNYKLKDIIKSYRGEKFEAVFSKNDVLPFFAESILLPYLYFTR